MNEFLLQDRIQKIQSINEKYNLEENAYISFSGGKDSTVLHYLIDEALPNNKIPRVYANTGIEFKLMYEYVSKMSDTDSRIKIIKPSVNIQDMLKTYGYPFKSKIHSMCVNLYQTDREKNMWKGYMGLRPEQWHTHQCPQKLRYQFSDDFKLKISDKCCFYMKEEPLVNWAKENKKSYAITGIMREEGGRRNKSSCLVFSGSHLKKFQPLSVLTKDWENWYIEKRNIKLCELYYPPYNFERTGCKGCPFNIHIKNELSVLSELLPSERKQCEIIWKPVYEEYRRIGYRLSAEQTLFD